MKTRYIPVSKLLEGMVLAKKVFNLKGGLLLKEGVSLTERHIKVMASWGIKEACIFGGDEGDGWEEEQGEQEKPSLSQKEIRVRVAALEKVYAKVKQDAYMREIFRVAKRQLLRSLRAGD